MGAIVLTLRISWLLIAQGTLVYL